MTSLVQSCFFNGVVPAANYVTNHFEQVDFAYNLAQAGCTKKANDSPRFFSRLDRAKTPLLIADVASLVWTGALAMYHTSQKISWIANTTLSPDLLGNLIVLGCFITSAVVLGASYGISKVGSNIFKTTLQKSLGDTEGLDLRNVKPSCSEHDRFKKVLYISRAITNVALACLFPHNPFYLMNAALELYSFVKIAQRKWIKFSQELDVHGYRVRLTYFFVMRAISGTIPEDSKSCAICFEDMQPSNATHFCENHFYHKRCVVPVIQNQSKSFGKQILITGRKVHVTTYSDGRRPTYKSSYRMTAPQDNQPSCPLCRGISSVHGFKAKVYDGSLNTWSPAAITLLSPH